jgi:glycosyltransferase involved in cell wall biosynthesis
MSRPTSIQIVGPVCKTGYGVVTANLIHALSQQHNDVRYLPMRNADTRWFVGPIQDSIEAATRRQDTATTLPEHTMCIWHEWDHPPDKIDMAKLSKQYTAMPIFELDTVKPEAINALSKCKNIMVTSQHNEQALKGVGLTNVSFVPFCGVDQDIFKPVTKPKRSKVFRISNIGKLEYRKGHDILIRLLAYMLRHGIEVELWGLVRPGNRWYDGVLAWSGICGVWC